MERELKKLQLDRSDDEEESASDGRDSSSDDEKDIRKSRGKLKSGKSSKPTSPVVNPQLWPHSELNTSFITKSVSFETLTLDEFVAGYSSILQSLDPSTKEFKARLAHLNSLMYLCGRYEWRAVLDFHGAVLLDIERGRGNWGDSFSYLESRTLHGNLKSSDARNFSEGVPSPAQGRFQSGVFYCKDYILGKCRYKKDHFGVIGRGSEQKWLRHICASCWVRSQALKQHTDLSPACPFFASKSASVDSLVPA